MFFKVSPSDTWALLVTSSDTWSLLGFGFEVLAFLGSYRYQLRFWALIDDFGFSSWTLDRFQLLFLNGFSFLEYGEMRYFVSLDVTICVSVRF
ncbi:hypothetical protein RIR_jg33306.t1 [Rhizophagus irregularis DAOM 181602=DAOM 197198]|nr:hypothetical protein RIR_jg33306.t1 [Rhizophagus irregularis DAOM 181602=DAOM 197198]